MPAFALRFVGQEALPPRLTEFDLVQFFTPLSDDVVAIRAQFRRDHRLPAALMLGFRAKRTNLHEMYDYPNPPRIGLHSFLATFKRQTPQEGGFLQALEAMPVRFPEWPESPR